MRGHDAAAARFPDQLPRDFMTNSDDYWSMFVGSGAVLQNGGDLNRIPEWLRDAANDIERQLLHYGDMFTEGVRSNMGLQWQNLGNWQIKKAHWSRDISSCRGDMVERSRQRGFIRREQRSADRLPRHHCR